MFITIPCVGSMSWSGTVARPWLAKMGAPVMLMLSCGKLSGRAKECCMSSNVRCDLWLCFRWCSGNMQEGMVVPHVLHFTVPGTVVLH